MFAKPVGEPLMPTQTNGTTATELSVRGGVRVEVEL